MKKIVVSSLVGLLFLSCSVPVPNNLSKKEDFSSLVTKYNFTDLEKEYYSFSTKALSHTYVRRMFTKFLTTGTANPTQVIRQLEFARYLKDVKSDTSYFDSLNTIISDDPAIYDKINNTSGVLDKKNGEPNFRNFLDNLNPAIPSGFKLVAKGTFVMGMTGITEPTHTVTFTKDLYMGEKEVTQGEWAFVYDFAVTYDAAHSTNYSTLMGSKYPSYFTGSVEQGYPDGTSRDNLPVEMVSWWNVIAFCNVKSLASGLNVAYDAATGSLLNGTGVGGAIGSVTTDTTQVSGYRLPTEAEWEYAARGGKDNYTNGNIYSGSNTVENVAWYKLNSGNRTHEVGIEKVTGINSANELGLYDMNGNVFEWTQDYFLTYSSASLTNKYISTGINRVLRSGSWNSAAVDMRSARRSADSPGNNTYLRGFRFSRTAL